MDLNLQKEQFSIAYVQAVAAVAGVKVSRTEVDDDSIDVGLERTGGYAPKLDLQLKCTGDVLPVAGGDLSFALKLKNYDDLRRPTLAPRWLVLMFVPEACPDWLEITSTPETIVRRCAWWVSLEGAPDVSNSTSVTIQIPRANLFTADAVMQKLDEVESQFRSV